MGRCDHAVLPARRKQTVAAGRRQDDSLPRTARTGRNFARGYVERHGLIDLVFLWILRLLPAQIILGLADLNGLADHNTRSSGLALILWRIRRPSTLSELE
jgi:hypothetical protein